MSQFIFIYCVCFDPWCKLVRPLQIVTGNSAISSLWLRHRFWGLWVTLFFLGLLKLLSRLVEALLSPFATWLKFISVQVDLSVQDVNTFLNFSNQIFPRLSLIFFDPNVGNVFWGENFALLGSKYARISMHSYWIGEPQPSTAFWHAMAA